MTFRSLLGFVAVRLRRPCVVQRFGNLRDGVQYGAFAANLRNDLADIRIRRNITTVMHGDGETAWTEYTADEAYTIRDLTEQEAIEQADSIWLDCVQASKSDSQRLAGLEASSLDQDEALAEIYQLLSGGEA